MLYAKPNLDFGLLQELLDRATDTSVNDADIKRVSAPRSAGSELVHLSAAYGF
jgi:hypothetical protein